ncbi:hypothetical protein ACFQ9Z_14225 [Streptomyces sp. NPDC056580]
MTELLDAVAPPEAWVRRHKGRYPDARCERLRGACAGTMVTAHDDGQ